MPRYLEHPMPSGGWRRVKCHREYIHPAHGHAPGEEILWCDGQDHGKEDHPCDTQSHSAPAPNAPSQDT